MIELAKALKSRVCVLDLEATTGNRKSDDFGVVEVSAVTFHPDGGRDCLSTLVNPGGGKRMDRYVSKITGISDDMLVGSPTFGEISGKLFSMLDGAVLVGFGVDDFDSKVLARSFHEHGFDAGWSLLELRTLWMAYSGTRKGKLSEVFSILGGTGLEKFHRADADVAASIFVGETLLARMGMGRVVEFVSPISRHGPSPRDMVFRDRVLSSIGRIRQKPGMSPLGWDGFLRGMSDEGFSVSAGKTHVSISGCSPSTSGISLRMTCLEFQSETGIERPSADWGDMRGKARIILDEAGDVFDVRELAVHLGAGGMNALALELGVMIRERVAEPWSGVPFVDRTAIAHISGDIGDDPQGSRRDIIRALRDHGIDGGVELIVAESMIVELTSRVVANGGGRMTGVELGGRPLTIKANCR